MGILIECREDMEIINLNASFKKDVFYTLVEDANSLLWVISREHIPVNISNRDILNRHFNLRCI